MVSLANVIFGVRNSAGVIVDIRQMFAIALKFGAVIS